MIKARYIEENIDSIHNSIRCEFVEIKKNWINGVTSLLLSWNNTPNTWFYNVFIV